jgi:hypothetical protein
MRTLLETNGYKSEGKNDTVRKRFKQTFAKTDVFKSGNTWLISTSTITLLNVESAFPESSTPSIAPTRINTSTWKGVPINKTPSTTDMRILLGSKPTYLKMDDGAIRQSFKRKWPFSAVSWTTDGWKINPVELGSLPAETLSQDVFHEYFYGKQDEMRLLLLTYTTPSVTWDDMRKLPRLHKTPTTVAVPDIEIGDYFFARFTPDCFVFADQCLVPSTKLLAMETVLEASLVQCTIEYQKLEAEISEKRRLINVGCEANKRQRYLALSAVDRAVRNVYTYIRSTVSKHLSADGGDTNAEITESSAERLIKMLIDAGFLHELSVFFDGGCAYNVLAAHIAQRVGCKVWGCEYIPTRTFIAAGSMLLALEDAKGIGSLTNPMIAYIFSDLFALSSFGLTTLAYFFDEAFPMTLIRHLLYVAANTPSVKYIVSFKASKRRSVHNVFFEYGFERVGESLHVKKTGSKESNTVYVYQRCDTSDGKARKKPPQLSCQGTHLGKEALTIQLASAWGTKSIQRQYYQDVYGSAEGILSKQRSGVPDVILCPCEYCVARGNERKVLWLGMAYAETDTTSADDIAELTVKKKLTPAQGRDTARCVAAEAGHDDVAIYTLAKDSNNEVRFDRHIKTDFSKKTFVADIRKKLEPPDSLFAQVALDYIWMPKSYLKDRMGGGKGVMSLLTGLASLVCVGGSVFLPFHIDVLVCLSETASWEKQYSVTMLDEARSDRNILFEATNTISHLMPSHFGKKADQEQLYCKVTKMEVQQSGLVTLSTIGKTLSNLSAEAVVRMRFVQLILRE